MTSGKSMTVLNGALRLRIEIYRLDTDPVWSLEVVDPWITSHAWEEQLASARRGAWRSSSAVSRAAPRTRLQAIDIIEVFHAMIDSAARA